MNNESINNGRPAYPHPSLDGLRGMSIRTAIAMRCMAGYNATSHEELITAHSDKRAEWAVDDADTLIARLTKDGGVL